MTLKNAKYRCETLGYEVDKGNERKYRFKKVGAFRWTEIDDLDTMLAFIGYKGV